MDDATNHRGLGTVTSFTETDFVNPATSVVVDLPHDSVNLDGPDTALALALLRAMPDPVYLVDPDGRLTQVNPAGLAQLDLENHADAHGRFLWELWPETSAVSLKAALSDAAEGETVDLIAPVHLEDGSAAELAICVQPLENGANLVSKLLVIARAA